MKIIFQLVDLDSGVRSEAGSSDRETFARELAANINGLDRTAVIVLCDDIRGEMYFSQAPLMSAQRFVELFASEDR